MIDIPTIALVLGLADLAFAAAATFYFKSSPQQYAPLALWRSGRALIGIGLLLVWARTLVTLDLLPTLSHLLMLGGSALELAAYIKLIDRQGWRWPLLSTAVLALLVRVALPLMEVPREMLPVYFSLVMAGFYAAMGAVLLHGRRASPLEQLIGANNLIAALLFLFRVAWGIGAGGLMPFATSLPNLMLWIGTFVISILNGYGFLLIGKQQEDQRLRQAHARLAAAEAEQRELLSMVSHEFRTPTAMIQASLDSLKHLRDETTPAVASRIHNIALANRRLYRLADALICQDRLRNLRIETIARPVDLGALARTVATTDPTQPRCTIADGLPLIHADAELLEIALHNLIDNANLHGTSAEPPEIRVYQDGRALELSVADQGVGIPDASKDRIFERFNRGRGSRGSGLGLPIVRKIAALHGGSVRVRDNCPRGAVFVLRLPLRPASALADAP
ncbi:MAG: hypothetical protein EOM91_02190 [Sphingobacteriia bacterium]|nr:hypothetical protein [Sphingobacteriia bacterium]NCC38527.1 hypothetical protein [Gammaproteobacteria bacterium]